MSRILLGLLLVIFAVGCGPDEGEMRSRKIREAEAAYKTESDKLRKLEDEKTQIDGEIRAAQVALELAQNRNMADQIASTDKALKDIRAKHSTRLDELKKAIEDQKRVVEEASKQKSISK